MALIQVILRFKMWQVQNGEIRLVLRRRGEEETLGAVAAGPGRHYLKVEARDQEYSFYYADSPEAWVPVAEKADGRVLSTQVAGGFVGAYIGLYASANGHQSGTWADFDYFEYAPL